MKTQPRHGENGAVLLLTTLVLVFVILPALGLAIDAGVLFVVKAHLQSATDASALAAARSLSRFIDPTLQHGAADAAARKYYAANVQDGWMGTGSPTIDVTFPTPPDPKTTIIEVSTGVDTRLYFMWLMGSGTTRVSAIGRANRRDVNIVMVLDRSKSLADSASCGPLKDAASTFINSFVDGRDRLGLITFGTTYRSDFDPAFDFRSRTTNNMLTIVNNILCVGGTNAAAAYWLAYQKLVTINEPGAYNVILFFTDGQPNTLHMSAIPIRSTSSCTNKSDRNGVVTPAGAAIWGIIKPVEASLPPVPNPDYFPITSPSSSGCSFAAGSAPNFGFGNVTNDVQYLTKSGSTYQVDVNANSLIGYKAVSPTAGPLPLNATTVTNAGINALDNAAQRVRSESRASTLNVVTYCIGLGGPGAAEDTLMKRISNVQDSPIYSNLYPRGMYVYASNASQLNQAFSALASEILRLSM